MVVSEKFSNFVVPMRVEGSAEVRPLSVVGGKLVGLSKVALITSTPPSLFLLYKLKDFRYLSQYRLSFKGLAAVKTPQKFTFLKPYIMTQKTNVQKVKDLIAKENLSKKRALEGLVEDITFIEIYEEEDNYLVIRDSALDCFPIPPSIVRASQRLKFSFMVSTRFQSEEQGKMTEFPVLVMHF